jgi:hypothetical protein
MPIPELSPDGFLPTGVFDCTLDEIRQKFGSFRGTERRPKLFARFEEFVTAIRRSNLFEAILIDGSFVTEKAVPNDIVLIAVLHPGHDFERDFSLFEYALLSRHLLRQRFGFDVVLSSEVRRCMIKLLSFFERVRESTDLRKGLLRLPI